MRIIPDNEKIKDGDIITSNFLNDVLIGTINNNLPKIQYSSYANVGNLTIIEISQSGQNTVTLQRFDNGLNPEYLIKIKVEGEDVSCSINFVNGSNIEWIGDINPTVQDSLKSGSTYEINIMDNVGVCVHII